MQMVVFRNYIAVFIIFTLSCAALANTKFFPCGAGIRHIDRNTEIKAGSNRLTATSGGVESNFLVHVGSASFKGPHRSWEAPIEHLSFDLGTEVYGAEYFLEMCYLGPLEQKIADGPQANIDLSEAIYKLSLSFQFSNILGIPLYRQTAQLYQRQELACDLRKRGAYRNPRTLSETSIGAVEPDLYMSTEYVPMDQNAAAIEVFLNEQMTQVPRFCTFRIYFSEDSVQRRLHKLSVKDVEVDNFVGRE